MKEFNVQKPHTSLNITEIMSGATSGHTSKGRPWSFVLPVASSQAKRRPLRFIILALVAPVLAVVALALLLACILIASVALIPFLFASLLLTRLLQIFRKGDDYDKITQIKLLIRVWIFLDMIPALLAFYIWFLMEGSISDLKSTFDFLPEKWFDIICMLYGFYTLALILNISAHRLPRLPLEYNESGINMIEAVCEVINCLIFWWAAYQVAKLVPSFKKHEIYGLLTKKWVKVFLLLVIGCNTITLITHVIVCFLWKLCREVEPGANVSPVRYFLIAKLLHRHDLVYWANGVSRIVVTILTLGMILATWLLYFGNRLVEPDDVNLLDFGGKSLVSLLICSFLWLIKTCLVLSWDALAIFSRLRPRILVEKKKLYFLGIIGRHKYDFFGLGEEGAWTVRRRRIKELLLQKDENLTMYDLQQVAQCFFAAKKALSAETYTSDIFEFLKTSGDDENFKTNLRRLIDGDTIANAIDETNGADQRSSVEDNKKESEAAMQDWSDFEELIANVNANTFVGKTETWMEKARDSCEILANMLSSAREFVNCLDNMIIALIIGATFILWLLLTGLATTQILVLFTSPLLAATFIFGDTCKSLFQGIIFVYVVHPFDVGDLCTIDDKMMEVKSVGIWKTTFAKVEKVGIQEEIIYPNSELAKKTVINYKTEFDWDDCVTFNVGCLEETQIKELKGQIESYLVGEKEKFIPDSLSVAILATGDNIKIVARFKYKMRMKGGTYFECLKVKDKLRSQFSLHVHNLLSKKKGSCNTSDPPRGPPPMNTVDAATAEIVKDNFEINYNPADY